MTHIYSKRQCNACNNVMATRAIAATQLPHDEFVAILWQNQHARAQCDCGPCPHLVATAPRQKMSATPGEAFGLTPNGAKIHDKALCTKVHAKRIVFTPVEIVYDYRRI